MEPKEKQARLFWKVANSGISVFQRLLEVGHLYAKFQPFLSQVTQKSRDKFLQISNQQIISSANVRTSKTSYLQNLKSGFSKK